MTNLLWYAFYLSAFDTYLSASTEAIAIGSGSQSCTPA